MRKTTAYIPFLLRNTSLLSGYIEKNYPLTMEELRDKRKKLNWKVLARNPNLPWSLDLFMEFDDELTIREENISKSDWEKMNEIMAKPGQYYKGIYKNRAIPWSVEIVDFVKDKLSWFMFTQIFPLENSVEMLDRYSECLDFKIISFDWKLPWTPELLERHATKWVYVYLTHRLTSDVNTDKNVLKTLQKIDPKGYIFGKMISNRYRKPPIIEPDPELIERKQRLSQSDSPLEGEDLLFGVEVFGIDDLAFNPRVKWTSGLIDYLSDRHDWPAIFGNTQMPVTEALIEKYIDKIPFGKNEGKIFVIDGISLNEQLPWSVPFIKKFRDHWNWKQLSLNYSIPRTEEMLESFADLWDWEIICCSWGKFWSPERIRKYADRLCWTGLSQNIKIKFTPELLEEFEGKWDTEALQKNKAFKKQVMKTSITSDIRREYIESLT